MSVLTHSCPDIMIEEFKVRTTTVGGELWIKPEKTPSKIVRVDTVCLHTKLQKAERSSGELIKNAMGETKGKEKQLKEAVCHYSKWPFSLYKTQRKNSVFQLHSNPIIKQSHGAVEQLLKIWITNCLDLQWTTFKAHLSHVLTQTKKSCRVCSSISPILYICVIPKLHLSIWFTIIHFTHLCPVFLLPLSAVWLSMDILLC